MNELEVKKQLFKSKGVAKISHFVGGNVYYTVDLEDGTYQFPMSLTETIKVNDLGVKVRGEMMEKVDIEIRHNYEDVEPLYVYDNDEEKYVEATCKVLSSDLGTTTFYAEMRGSELNRWIAMAIDSGEFVKVS